MLCGGRCGVGSCHFVGGLEEGSGPPHGVQVPESMSGERQRKAEEGGGVVGLRRKGPRLV